jgi:hypothetical protein
MVLGLQSSLSEQSQALRTPAANCESTRKYELLLNKLEPALKIVSAASNADVAKYGNGLLASVPGERTAVATQLAKLCKP